MPNTRNCSDCGAGIGADEHVKRTINGGVLCELCDPGSSATVACKGCGADISGSVMRPTGLCYSCATYGAPVVKVPLKREEYQEAEREARVFSFRGLK